ncbi:hypothetical protein PSTEL_19115 [Paenibacillus stellifer]|uniref:HTH gntR-type domain-containing protein n=1 Tax=Paenibacillus stellifer TaxID=169760 RepID=A0A089M0A8_9BACL|nr:extracellular solute-binding protein [Paenibacillus stellifer]AIQ64908.1 hypothetical protein PSTEL_19115 [Paenibacillus stellifer]
MNNKEFRYIEMAGILRMEILSGFLKPGQFLLPEKELCQLYNISRNSLRQALELLTNEGLLIKMVGRGTMVAKDLDITKHESNVINIICPYDSSYVRKALPILIEMFKEQYPHVEFREFKTELRNEKLLKDLSGFGIRADLVIISDHDMQHLPLEEFLALEDIIPEQEVNNDQLVNVFRHEGRQYAVPLTYSPVFLACNPRLFSDNGLEMPTKDWSWEQFAEAARIMTRDANGDGQSDIYGLGLSSSLYRWPVLARKYGCSLQQESSGTLNIDGLGEFLRYIQTMIYKDGSSPAAAINDWELLAQLFDEGHLGMFLTTTLTTGMHNGDFPVTVIPIPMSPEAHKGNLTIANGMMIPQTSGNPKLAKLFAEFSMRMDYQMRMASEAKFLSVYPQVNKVVWTELELGALGLSQDNPEHLYFMHEFLPNSAAEILHSEMIKFWAGFDAPDELAHRLQGLFAPSEPPHIEAAE